MKENFVVNGFNHHMRFPRLGKIIASLIIAFIIVFPVLGFATFTAILTFIILALLMYIIITSMTTENLSNELPSTLYPSLPHMGLDGISMNSYVAGMDVRKYAY